MDDCIFCKIANGAVDAKLLYEDEHCIVFEDINPEKPTHLLIVPRKHIQQLSKTEQSDELIVGHLLHVTRILSEKFNLPDYKVIINNGAGAGQTVFHLHVHFQSDKSYK